MNPFKSIYNWWAGLAKAFRHEMHTITHDAGVLVFFLVLPLAYPLIYTIIYNPEVVTDLPVAVVDHSRTARSRELVRMVDATPELRLYDYAADMGEARRLWSEQNVIGVLEIPADYDQAIGRGEQAHATFFCDMSLLLRYRAALSALTSVQLATGSQITQARINGVGADGLISASPVEVDTNFLGDTQQGFASFIMPGIVVLILQQSMVLGICLIAGTRSDRRRRGDYITDIDDYRSPASASVLGKALAYTVFYLPATIYILHYVPAIFNLPHQGDPVQWLLFALPLLLASAMFGLMLSHMMREREDAFIYIVFTSVVFLFMSGLTWPMFAMPDALRALSRAVPATAGVEGFVHINSNGATLAEQSGNFLWLWLLAGIYFLGAVLLQAILNRHARRAIGRA
ncbi:MAG: ABC transporter permease [Muribaculaceae bacterium]|nr:ABC transporter permease [Muribaculaceae bacterium]